jgi:hypothetical protein
MVFGYAGTDPCAVGVGPLDNGLRPFYMATLQAIFALGAAPG